MKTGFEKVSDEVLPLFVETSKEILKKHTPEDALCRALALITGYTQKMMQRSLLCSAEGYVTI